MVLLWRMNVHTTRRGAALTGQLLTFARRQSVNPQPIRFGDRVEAIREVLHAGVGSAVRLAFEIERDLWPIRADVSELETGLLNLVINARDAMPDGGTVTIGAHNIVLNDPLHSGEYVAITVADTGLGIPSDVVDKIFEPFFTTKPVGKGTGLGLSQVHGFAHQAGGTVKVESYEKAHTGYWSFYQPERQIPALKFLRKYSKLET